MSEQLSEIGEEIVEILLTHENSIRKAKLAAKASPIHIGEALTECSWLIEHGVLEPVVDDVVRLSDGIDSLDDARDRIGFDEQPSPDTDSMTDSMTDDDTDRLDIEQQILEVVDSEGATYLQDLDESIEDHSYSAISDMATRLIEDGELRRWQDGEYELTDRARAQTSDSEEQEPPNGPVPFAEIAEQLLGDLFSGTAIYADAYAEATSYDEKQLTYVARELADDGICNYTSGSQQIELTPLAEQLGEDRIVEVMDDYRGVVAEPAGTESTDTETDETETDNTATQAPPTPDEILRDNADLYERKNADYGAAWKLAGATMAQWAETSGVEAVDATDPEAMQSLCLLIQRLHKLVRGFNLEHSDEDPDFEGIVDSHRDESTYAAMHASLLADGGDE